MTLRAVNESAMRAVVDPIPRRSVPFWYSKRASIPAVPLFQACLSDSGESGWEKCARPLLRRVNLSRNALHRYIGPTAKAARCARTLVLRTSKSGRVSIIVPRGSVSRRLLVARLLSMRFRAWCQTRIGQCANLAIEAVACFEENIVARHVRAVSPTLMP